MACRSYPEAAGCSYPRSSGTLPVGGNRLPAEAGAVRSSLVSDRTWLEDEPEAEAPLPYDRYLLVMMSLFLGIALGGFGAHAPLPRAATVAVTAVAAAGALFLRRGRTTAGAFSGIAVMASAGGLAGGVLRLYLKTYQPPTGTLGGQISYGMFGALCYFLILFTITAIGYAVDRRIARSRFFNRGVPGGAR
ncbi:hypothetical protein JW905_16500 [bacterium]|nr:hypothetical protein [candidate division CSSED10-310 bacterium]